ncbi:MAG: PA0069 family radical SAM protein [Rhodospirillaceae bacterium]|nr:PA0069 family radical SAM protein [Rhodospirillaceae bacterium]
MVEAAAQQPILHSRERYLGGALAGTHGAHPDARRGRGVVGNPSGRYEREHRQSLDDGWDNLDAPPPPLRTQVLKDASRSIIARNQSPDIPFDRSINPYRGCEHGCTYCFARPTHAWLGLSPGLDFESKIYMKPEAPTLLDKALRARGYQCRTMAMGTNTDPYQPVERKYQVTRGVLEVLARFNHPVGIVTKSALIARDIDILAPMAAKQLAKVAVSVTTLDGDLARTMEPRASTPLRRLEAIRKLSAAGIPTAVMFAPVIPGLNDHEMEQVLTAARDAGAREAGYVVLKLPLEVRDLFQEWLTAAVPGRAKHVMTLVRAMRNGRDYDPEWGTRMSGVGPIAEAIRQRFVLACKRLGLNERTYHLDATQFRVPVDQTSDQLSLAL